MQSWKAGQEIKSYGPIRFKSRTRELEIWYEKNKKQIKGTGEIV